MLQFLDLTLRNFLSYGNVSTTVQLNKSGVVLIAGTNGVGKAQPFDCLIKTPGGWTQMKDIHLGADIIAADGTICQVDGVYPQGELDIYKITFADGRTVECCADHLWNVSSVSYNGTDNACVKTISTSNIIEHLQQYPQQPGNGWYSLYIDLPEHENQIDIPLPMDPYLLGVLLGDGHMANSVTISSSDDEIIDRCDETLKRTLNMTLKKLQGQYDWGVRSNLPIGKQFKPSPIQTILKELELKDSRSYNKFIPEIYKLSSKAQKLELLKGLFDTDGYIGKGQAISFSTSSAQLANDVQYIVRSLGGVARIRTHTPHYTYKGEYKAGRTCYTVAVRYAQPIELFYLTRKRDRVKTTHQYANKLKLRIENVEWVGKKEAQCIHINHETHLYVTNNFVVTHNTTLIQSLLYVLYDKTLSGCKVDELINNVNKKHMEVSVTFYKPNDGYYKILRARKMKAGGSGNYVNVYYNKDEPVFNKDHDITLDGTSNTDKKILSIINIPYEMFVRIVVISATSTAFLELPVVHATQPSQTSFIERLFNMTILADKASVLKDLIKSTEDSLKAQTLQIQAIEREQARLIDQIQNVKIRADNFDNVNQAKIADLEKKLALITDINIEHEKELYAKSAELDAIKKKMTKQQATLSATVTKNEKLQAEKIHEINHLNANTCPYCLQAYTNKAKIAECEAQIAECVYNIAELLEFIDAIAVDIQTTTAKHEDIINQITVHNLEELIDIKNESQYTAQKITELQEAPNVYYEQYQELKDTCIDEIDYTESNRLRTLSEHQQFLMKLLTKKDSFIRKKLLTVNLQYLNSRLQHYLVDLELPFKVEFTHQMTAEITHLGREISSNNLSNGQRSRVNIAMTMAFRDVRQKLHTPVNICLFDEALDVGLDGAGMTAAISMLKRKAREENTTLYIITHREETMTLFDQVLDVKMVDGFSVITGDI